VNKTVTKAEIDLYQKVADLTKPKCGACRVPNSCCDSMYCDLATDRAKELGVELKPTGFANKKNLLYMSETGCVVPPYLRPLCAVHVCENHYMSDQKFAKEYFALREQLEEIEWGIFEKNSKDST
jgi:hypothetical protein